ncbi:MAG TPA: dipeptidyl aminopeptidase [Actinomycetes bacterium]|nr:dipeptidyl aminopeptidase [Actinomycetes bacterium]
MAHRFFQTEQFNFETQLAFGGVWYGGGDVGELLGTVDRISDGDADSWCEQWTATADRVATIADGCAAGGHRISARAAYLRASVYYALVLSSVDGTKDPAALLGPTFRAHRRCFDAYVARLDPPGEKVEIPYEGTSMPGYFFGPDPTGGPRPTLILNNGSDGPVTSLWPPLGAGAVARGYNALVFDGPGQQSMLFERGVPFRHDWEQVIGPVVDFLAARPDVDGARIALYGISQAGYWVPRALAFEHRVAAGIADPGVYDAFEPWRTYLPEPLRRLLDAGDKAQFDQFMEAGLDKASPAERQNWEWRAKPYGMSSPYEVFSEARKYNLDGVIDKITTPLLVTDPEGEQFWPGQSRRLYDALPGPKQLVGFSADEGADRHCEPMARSLLEQRLFDWLDDTLGRSEVG